MIQYNCGLNRYYVKNDCTPNEKEHKIMSACDFVIFKQNPTNKIFCARIYISILTLYLLRDCMYVFIIGCSYKCVIHNRNPKQNKHI